MKQLAAELKEAFIATLKSIQELTIGMTVQVMIRGRIQKVGIVTAIDPDKQSATVEDYLMKGKFTSYDNRYAFYQVPLPKEVVLAGEQTEGYVDSWQLYDHLVGRYVQVFSRSSGVLVCVGPIISVDSELNCIRVRETSMGTAGGHPGDMAQEYCHGAYRFFIPGLEDDAPGTAVDAPAY